MWTLLDQPEKEACKALDCKMNTLCLRDGRTPWVGSMFIPKNLNRGSLKCRKHFAKPCRRDATSLSLSVDMLCSREIVCCFGPGFDAAKILLI